MKLLAVALALFLVVAKAHVVEFERQRSRHSNFMVDDVDHPSMHYDRAVEDWSWESPFDIIEHSRGGCDPSPMCGFNPQMPCCYPCIAGSARCPNAQPPSGVCSFPSVDWKCLPSYQVRGYTRAPVSFFLQGMLTKKHNDVDWFKLDITEENLDENPSALNPFQPLFPYRARGYVQTPYCHKYKTVFPSLAMLAPLGTECVDPAGVAPPTTPFDDPADLDLPFDVPAGYGVLVAKREFDKLHEDPCNRTTVEYSEEDVYNYVNFYDHPRIECFTNDPAVYYFAVYADRGEYRRLKNIDYSLATGFSDAILQDIDIGKILGNRNQLENGASHTDVCFDPCPAEETGDYHGTRRHFRSSADDVDSNEQ